MDDLTRIKGLGRTAAKKLAEAGITTFEQLAHDGLAGHHGIQADWIAQAADLLHENTKEKPPRSDSEPEAQLQDGAGLPADSGAGDPYVGTTEFAVAPAFDAWHAFEALDAETAQERFPRTIEALRVWAERAGSAEKVAAGPTIRIAARRDGFRRCGLAHPKMPTDHVAERFTPDELERLLAEPRLSVELV